ncbi:MAG TPA: GNAT family N-acetyltransferase [Acetobacteraceae bacterium]|nr:GNAT family N-acetyltransferase [Acetobacteraceae bacterium]
MSSAAFRLRPAGPDDAGPILRMVRALAEYERAPDAVMMTESSLRQALSGLPPAAEAVIAEHGGQPAGFAIWFSSFSTWTGRPGLYVEDVFVMPGARGQGIGRAMFRHVAKLAVERDCARLEWSVLDWNRPAIDFYRGLGAEPLDEWTRYRLSGAALDALAA